MLYYFIFIIQYAVFNKNKKVAMLILLVNKATSYYKKFVICLLVGFRFLNILTSKSFFERIKI